MLSNTEILNLYVQNGLIEECVKYQFRKLKEPWKGQFSGDMINDLVVVISEYDNAKLNDVHSHNHMNAWLTRVLQNNLYSNSSKFFNSYLKFLNRSNELPVEDDDLEDDE